jgi:hypothetical protein
MDAIDHSAALLDCLESAGLSVRMVDGALRVGPPHRLTDVLRTDIRLHRESIVSLLATAQPAPPLDVDLLACPETVLLAAIEEHPDLTASLIQEAERLGQDLRRDGADAIAAFRWFARHPAPGYDRGDHFAALLAVRTAAGRAPPEGSRSGVEPCHTVPSSGYRARKDFDHD